MITAPAQSIAKSICRKLRSIDDAKDKPKSLSLHRIFFFSHCVVLIEGQLCGFQVSSDNMCPVIFVLIFVKGSKVAIVPEAENEPLD